MSIKVTSWIWEKSTLRSTNLLMLLALADNCNDTGVCFPGIKYLAAKARVSQERARKILKDLREAGELRVETHKGVPTPHGNTNRYYLIRYRESIGLEKPAPSEGSDSTPQGGSDITRGVEYNPPGGSDITGQEGSDITPYPSEEPSVEPDDSITSDPMYDMPIGPAILPVADSTQTDKAEVFQAVHQKLGWTMTPTIVDDITDTLNEFGKDLVIQAIANSAKHNPSSWNYVRKTLHTLRDSAGSENPASPAIDAIIKAYIQTQQIIDDNPGAKKGYRDAASALHAAGITAEDVTDFIQWRRGDPFWVDNTLTWDHIKKNILTWKTNRDAEPDDPAHRLYEPEEKPVYNVERNLKGFKEIAAMFAAQPMEDAS